MIQARFIVLQGGGTFIGLIGAFKARVQSQAIVKFEAYIGSPIPHTKQSSKLERESGLAAKQNTWGATFCVNSLFLHFASATLLFFTLQPLHSLFSCDTVHTFSILFPFIFVPSRQLVVYSRSQPFVHFSSSRYTCLLLSSVVDESSARRQYRPSIHSRAHDSRFTALIDLLPTSLIPTSATASRRLITIALSYLLY